MKPIFFTFRGVSATNKEGEDYIKVLATNVSGKVFACTDYDSSKINEYAAGVFVTVSNKADFVTNYEVNILRGGKELTIEAGKKLLPGDVYVTRRVKPLTKSDLEALLLLRQFGEE